MQIRLAKPSDAEELINIYRPYVEQSAITFEYEVPAEREFRERIRRVGEKYPYLICENEGEILGYCYAHEMHERAAYQWDAELSVYVKQNKRGRGIGTLLYQMLLELLKLQRIQTVTACITLPNEESRAFHESFGFRQTGYSAKAGYKLGEWHDVGWFELALGEHENPPRPFIAVSELNL
ncbi:N-acetyltransferase family protein [Anaerolentibacter hominis]|uniref:GNAT family N-acetyltransferase n=1 Tax=Anaerolentibacter hominis TaxID=3079009 RepID=UPI0031B8680A